MEDQLACSPCVLESVLKLPSADAELLSLGLSSLSPQQRAPHEAAQVQPSPEQRTPDMALLDFPISEEEMEWLVALSYGDAPSSVGSGTQAVGTGPAAAEAASASTTVTAPMPQQEMQRAHPHDLMVPCTAFTDSTASKSEAAAGAAEFDNNCAWAADATAFSAGLAVPLPADQGLLQGLRLWSDEMQSATSLEQPHTPNSSGTSSRGHCGGKPRRSPQASLKRRGRRPADKSAFQRDIELFTLRVQEEEAARHRSAAPSQHLQPQQPLPQHPQPQSVPPATAVEHPQQGTGAAGVAVSAVAPPMLPHQSLTALLASCLGAQMPSQAAFASTSGHCAASAACSATDGVVPATVSTATAKGVSCELGGTEVPVQIVQYQLEDCSRMRVVRGEGGPTGQLAC